MRNVNGSNSYSMKEREGGFILTMRNVNIIISVLGTLGVTCFILTMRNVN
ncbi:TPA: hypothetical protein I9000_001512 [Clostridium perfringens]|nr:hypothetical protein [Clostridium perfringens]HAT4194008.1 hypothetical protein [Clostridium perfringens]